MSVSYDGTSYSGFQYQPHQHTIQSRIETAIYMLTKERVKILGSGRTDAGVHARKQVFNFYTECSIPIHRWRLALNSRLPDTIIVTDADEVPLEFHARRSAKRKTYCYTINCSKYPDVFQNRFQLHHPTPLNKEAMESALQMIRGTHDFRSFCSPGSSQTTFVRTLFDVWMEYDKPSPMSPHEENNLIRIFISGSGFLYHMVRIIVGTLLQIGEGKRSVEDMKTILEAQDRAKAGPTAMAHGLMLWDVQYDI